MTRAMDRIKIGDRLFKPRSAVALNAEGGEFGSAMFTVSELPKWHENINAWGCHGIRCDHLWREDGVHQVAEAYLPAPVPKTLAEIVAEKLDEMMTVEVAGLHERIDVLTRRIEKLEAKGSKK